MINLRTLARRLGALLALLPLVAAIAACNTGEGAALPVSGDLSAIPSNNDQGSGNGDGGPIDMTPPPPDMACLSAKPSGSCATCLMANCNGEMTECFTGTWSSTGSANGVCAGQFACECDCAAMGGNGCRASCGQTRGASCISCLQKLGTCVLKSCGTECPQ